MLKFVDLKFVYYLTSTSFGRLCPRKDVKQLRGVMFGFLRFMNINLTHVLTQNDMR